MMFAATSPLAPAAAASQAPACFAAASSRPPDDGAELVPPLGCDSDGCGGVPTLSSPPSLTSPRLAMIRHL